MKQRFDSYKCNILKERKKSKLSKQYMMIKLYLKFFKYKKVVGYIKSNRISVCKVYGLRRAIHSKINVSRHINRWDDNDKYLRSWIIK